MAWGSSKETRELFRNPANARKVVETVCELASRSATDRGAPKEREIELDKVKYRVIKLDLVKK